KGSTCGDRAPDGVRRRPVAVSAPDPRAGRDHLGSRQGWLRRLRSKAPASHGDRWGILRADPGGYWADSGGLDASERRDDTRRGDYGLRIGGPARLWAGD